MVHDPDGVLAGARAAREESRRLAAHLDEMRVESLRAQAAHLLVRHSPHVGARLRVPVEDGQALPGSPDVVV